ncbi:MAG: ATP-binding cassette domain-containing protein [Lachnospiraceae bacterium]|nr:ATP-binding cassette domain-containing protein [Lachnospiraceae bacterium]
MSDKEQIGKGTAIRVEHVSKEFKTKTDTVEALKDVSFSVEKGDIYGVIGLSGAGKSTLVRCLNLLERPDSGKIFIGEKELTALSEEELRVERTKIGMIFQHFNLLAQRTVLNNVCFPMEILGIPKNERREKALELLSAVGLSEKSDAYPSQLTGGQQQRVAIARVLAADPEILFCDEATSALDPQTTESILSLLMDINKRLGITIVVITHEMQVIKKLCNKVTVLEEGIIRESGTVSEVFTNPKTKAAKRLIYVGLSEDVDIDEEGNDADESFMDGI